VPVRAVRRVRAWQSALAACALILFSVLVAAGPASAATAPAPISITSSSCPTDITEGEVDGCVTEVQDLLNADDGAGLTVDGDFGAGTLAAVETFQKNHGLSADGIVGPSTKAALNSAGAPAAISLTSSSCPTDIADGEVDGCVTELQELLDTHGASVSVDGDFGPGTLAAVETFQGSAGLAQDGIVGPNTKAALMDTSSTVPAPIALSSSSCPADLTEGEVDGCVTELQELLNTHGASLGVDGDFGPDTLTAVETFQSAYGLSVDGIVGPQTKTALTSVNAAVPSAIPITSSSCPADMSQGEVDGCVTALQQLLNENGANLSVDGDFGPLTFNAVENYQASHGLSVDGIVGPDTKAALTGSATTSNPPPVSAATMQKIVQYATDIKNGDAEPGWSGGKVPYGWDGGHGPKPGPSTVDCAASGGDNDCWTATNNGTIGANGTIGIDCSGFVRWVYSLAYGSDVLGSSGTVTQVAEMTRVSTPTPGDAVFFGTNPAAPEHVGIYIGNGQMINAYETGYYVQVNQVTDVSNLIGYYQFGSGSPSSTYSGSKSTNYDWAHLVLSDGGWPQSSNNVTSVTQWMSSEEPASDWWHNTNPLNNGYDTSSVDGLDPYPNLTVAADDVAQNLSGGLYGSVVSDLATSAAPATTTQAIIDSPWSCGHYSGSATCNTDTSEWGAAFNHSTVGTYAAPASDW